MKCIIVCLGHIIGSCPHCIADEKNKDCSNYKPVRIWIFAVKGGEKNEKKFNSKRKGV